MPAELLRRDKNDTYTIPYTCCWFDEEWRDLETDETGQACIVGWSPIDERRRFRPLKKVAQALVILLGFRGHN